MRVLLVDPAAPAVDVAAERYYAKYYSYQAHGEPKFVLHPGDGFGFQSILGEVEALWTNAEPHHLTDSA